MKTILHTYRYNISNSEDQKAYAELCKKLNDGRHWLNCISIPFNKRENKHREAGPVDLETKFLFANQWNTTDGFRLFDWYEEIYDNRNIKQGHWLEITEEMKEIRRNTKVCGYCGYQEYNEAGEASSFCTSCLGSPYLKQDDLFLLRMLPVELYMPERKRLTKTELAKLWPLYIESQSKANHIKNIKLREDIQNKRAKAVLCANTEADGMLWLLDHGINIDNVIYYSHTNMFSFGWKQAISSDVKEKLTELLAEFPFQYEIKS